MEKILISACLLGEPVRYDGVSKPVNHELIRQLERQGRILPFCPEIAGGLPIPRPSAEIKGGDGRDVVAGRSKVKTRDSDVTLPFMAGAGAALAFAREHGVTLALLKERSPSCGSSCIYDGSFSGRIIPGMGVTAALLRMNEITVFSENQIDKLGNLLKQ